MRLFLKVERSKGQGVQPNQGCFGETRRSIPARYDRATRRQPSNVMVAAKTTATENATAEPRSSGSEAPAKTLGWVGPGLIFLVCAAVYVGMLGDRASGPSRDNHYVHLAHSWLQGRLDLVGDPPGRDDWACFDTQEQGMCPNLRWFFPHNDGRYRWYVTFPPFPAVLTLPLVATVGIDFADPVLWALLAGVAPMLLFVLLRRLSASGASHRSRVDNLLLTVLFAFGTVFFFVSVEGGVWYAAQVVATSLVLLYLLFGLEARRPFLAGCMLALAFMSRPTTLLLSVMFGVEALRISRRRTRRTDEDVHSEAPDESSPGLATAWMWLKDVRWGIALSKIAVFSIPILVVGGIAAWHNYERFGDPLEFGHTYLQIYWRTRIERWGLFNYHYFGRNLAVALASVPWFSAHAPYITVSRHGLALWVTTPNLLWALWPKQLTAQQVALWAGLLPVAIMNLMYQNSGWVQFGYRFALDYLPLAFVLIALGRRRFGPLFWCLVIVSVAVNSFGAATFRRMHEFYDRDPTQKVLFQPD